MSVFAASARTFDDLSPLVREIEELPIGPLRRTLLRDDDVPQVREDVFGDVREVEPLLGDPIDHLERRRRVPRHERRRELVQDRAIGDPEHARDVLRGQLLPAVSDDLIEQAHRVAHRPRGFAREHRHRRVLREDLLEREHLAEPPGDHLRRDQLEVVPLAAASGS